MTIKFKEFEALTNIELYELIALRIDVFVVEQNCAYSELDFKDMNAIHVLMYEKSKLVGTSRILPKGVSYPEISIGRVATSINVRGKSVGKEMLYATMDYIKNKWKNESVRISAQSHLEKFYNLFGFKHTGKSYLEDGIPHIEMLSSIDN